MQHLTEYEFVVKGEPVAWCVYTRQGEPPAQFQAMQAWQEEIRAAVIERFGRPLLDCAVTLDVMFFRTLPGPQVKTERGWEQRRKKVLLQRPDRSNYLKAFEDGLKGTLLRDDSVIVGGYTRKDFCGLGEQPYTHAKICFIKEGSRC